MRPKHLALWLWAAVLVGLCSHTGLAQERPASHDLDAGRPRLYHESRFDQAIPLLDPSRQAATRSSVPHQQRLAVEGVLGVDSYSPLPRAAFVLPYGSQLGFSPALGRAPVLVSGIRVTGPLPRQLGRLTISYRRGDNSQLGAYDSTSETRFDS